MPFFKRLKTSINDVRERENFSYELRLMSAQVAYIAMMNDLELSVEEPMKEPAEESAQEPMEENPDEEQN